MAHTESPPPYTPEPSWRDYRFRQGRDVVLAAGQVLARELDYPREHASSPLLFQQILDPEGTSPWGAKLRKDLTPFLENKRPSGKTGFLHLALAILEDWHRWETGQHDHFTDMTLGVGPGLVAMLGAGILLEGADNRFDDLPAFLALFRPLPSDWLTLAIELRQLGSSGEHLLDFCDDPDTPRSCLGAAVSLTPTGMAFMGMPPVETGAPEPASESQPSLFDDPERRPAQNRSRRTSRRAQPPPPPRAPEPSDIPKELIVLEKPRLNFEDLVLPEEAFLEMRFIAKFLKNQPKETPVMLFHGPPGTGKTHAARCLTGEIRRPLGVASLDQLLIKWHGDTEKAFRLAFQEAAKAKAVLLLDEADALLADRGTMHMTWQLSHVNTLLKLLEAPGVPVILCTNFLRVLDGAVHRRVQHLVEFPLPGLPERRVIWATELTREGFDPEGFDLEALGALPLTGGLIHNAVVQLQRRSKVYGEGFRVDTEALLAMARKELPKMDREVRPKRVGFEPPPATAEAGG